jgi:hypothetical protein
MQPQFFRRKWLMQLQQHHIGTTSRLIYKGTTQPMGTTTREQQQPKETTQGEHSSREQHFPLILLARSKLIFLSYLVGEVLVVLVDLRAWLRVTIGCVTGDVFFFFPTVVQTSLTDGEVVVESIFPIFS